MIWLVLLGSSLAFGVGFALSWRRMRRQIQARIDREVEAEIRRQIEDRVQQELSNGRIQKHVAEATRCAETDQQSQ